MSLQEHYVISALTYKYRKLENNIIFRIHNHFSEDEIKHEQDILDSFKETLDILGYIYNPVQKQVVKSITLNSRNGF
jgi:hypothetical protein